MGVRLRQERDIVSEVEIRAQERRDDEAVVAILQAVEPEFPHDSVEDYRFRRDGWAKFGQVYRQWVAVDSGTVVGLALLLEVKSEDPGIYWVEVAVHPDHRRWGTGSRLMASLLTETATLGCRRLLAEFMDTHEGTPRFADRHGFVPNGRGEQLSRLDVAMARLEGFRETEEALTQSGIRIERLVDMPTQDTSFMQALYRLDTDTHRDIPTAVVVDSQYDEWLEVIVNGPGRSPEWAWIAMHGNEPVGTARLRVYGDDQASNAYTGTRKDYRGRGIARALKYRTIAWCLENGVRYIYTGNEIENPRMLAINRALGYDPLPRTVEVAREL